MIEALIARLQAAVPDLKLIEGAAGFQRASESNPPATPAAYVFIVDEAGDGDATVDLPLIERERITISVVLVVRNVGDRHGAAAAQDMETLRPAVTLALRGFTPAPEHAPLSRRQSALAAFRDGHMWWQMTWETLTYVEGEISNTDNDI